VAKRGFLTSLITYTMRAGDEPRRTDRCLRPGAKRPKRCPEQ
jgi:hypothetical protein